MANARIARFITEVAPPQFVTVMRRRRASKMLDPIKEEERETNITNTTFSHTKTSSIDTTTPSSTTKYSSTSSFLSTSAPTKSIFFFKDDAAVGPGWRPSSSSVFRN